MRAVVTDTGGVTVYVGAYYEWVEGSGARRYYTHAGKRIAMRDAGGALHWLLPDHLGGTSITAGGDPVARSGELRYAPWGETRYEWGTTPTKRRYTGQIEESAIALYLMGARWYDPWLGRFLQPDTVVIDPPNPSDLNRFGYAYDAPLNYTDPTGHVNDASVGGGAPTDDELLEWLAAEMNAAVKLPEFNRIRLLNERFQRGRPLGAFAKVAAWHSFKELVKTGGPWDFKDKVEAVTQAKAQTMAGTAYEFSTTGNLFYGYVGTMMGFSEAELRGGAGVAQLLDFASDPSNPEKAPGLPSTLFDQPTDYAAVSAGIQLAHDEQYGIVVDDVRALLVSYDPLLAHAAQPQLVSKPPHAGPGRYDNNRFAPWPRSWFPSFPR